MVPASIPATASANLGPQYAAHNAADDHAGLFLRPLIGRATGNTKETAGHYRGYQTLDTHGTPPLCT